MTSISRARTPNVAEIYRPMFTWHAMQKVAGMRFDLHWVARETEKGTHFGDRERVCVCMCLHPVYSLA